MVDKPLIQYAVEEAVEAGVTELVFVTGRAKRSIEDSLRPRGGARARAGIAEQGGSGAPIARDSAFGRELPVHPPAGSPGTRPCGALRPACGGRRTLRGHSARRSYRPRRTRMSCADARSVQSGAMQPRRGRERRSRRHWPLGHRGCEWFHGPRVHSGRHRGKAEPGGGALQSRRGGSLPAPARDLRGARGDTPRGRGRVPAHRCDRRSRALGAGWPPITFRAAATTAARSSVSSRRQWSSG